MALRPALLPNLGLGVQRLQFAQALLRSSSLPVTDLSASTP